MFHDEQEPLEPEYVPVDLPEQREDQGFYETGNMDPPKQYAGVIAAMLMLLIFCGGLVGGVILNSRFSGETARAEEPAESGTLLSAGEVQDYAPQETREKPRDVKGSANLIISQTPDSVPNVAAQGGLALQEIYEKVSPSTVSITASGPASAASGSGIIMTEDGYVITNCHVISGASHLTVTLEDGGEYPAELVGKDNLSDLAVLHIEAEGLTPAEFGDSDSIRVGDSVTAIGDPLGIELRGTMTEGIVSAINRNLSIQGRNLTLIQTTAALNEGNSGGPLINCYGQVIGINTAKIGSVYASSGVEGIGFAIPINLAKEVVDQLIALGYVPGRPSLGVETTTLSYEYQMWFGLPEGLYITDVEEGSPAWEVGLRVGDVILSIADQRITAEEDLTAVLSTCSAGDSVSIVIYRRSRQYQGTLVLQEAGE